MFDAHGHDLVIDRLSCFILSDWVFTVYLARLDSAHCCNEKRDMFRLKEFLSTEELSLYKINRVSTEFWDWILQRVVIKLYHITFGTFETDTEKLDSHAKRHEWHIST